MDRHWDNNGAASAPTAPVNVLGPNVYPQGGVAPSEPGPWWHHMHTEELRNVILAAGMTPDRGSVNQLQAAISAMVDAAKMPAGIVLGVLGTVAPAGMIKANGALLPRASYPRLLTYALASGNITASDAAWSSVTTPGKFSPGDGSTTFRIPDLRALFPRYLDDGAGIDAGRVLGSYQADEFKSHVHYLLFNPTVGSVTAGGSGLASQSSYPTDPTGGSETRPKNTALLACITY